MIFKLYKKLKIQLSDYILSDYTARIRNASSKEKKLLQKNSVIKSLYKKLDLGMSGLEFVEIFFNSRFEQFMVEETRNSSEDISLYNNWSPDDDDDESDESENRERFSE
jgi:hypothetical protein